MPMPTRSPQPAPAWRSPIGLPGSTWNLSYADVRDDRVVIYGTANRSVSEFVYRIRATNAGTLHRAAGVWRIDV